MTAAARRPQSTAEAAKGFLAKLPDDLRINIVNPPDGENAYPIAGFTWILVKKDMQDEAKAHLGYEVNVTGELDGDSIKVTSIDEKKPPAK